MTNISIFVLISTIVCAIIIEIHCRLQLKLIKKPRTKLNLVIHYSIFLPFVGCFILFIIKAQSMSQSLELSELKTSLIFFGCAVCFVVPIIYIMDWRYPELLTKMENWRKNT